jgi:peptidoglycan/xylan/chitin deacetylase (PgdA/CDA1 family)
MWIDTFSRRFLYNSGYNGPITLMYHSIQSKKNHPKWIWSVSLDQFIQQLDLLCEHGWTTICATHLTQQIKDLPQKTVLITFDDGYADNFLAFEELVKRNMKATWFVVTQDLGQKSSWVDENTPSYPLLTATQLSEMQKAGMEIGSHTHSHCRLPQINAEQMHEELHHSKAYLSDLLNKPIISIAYPYGLYNPAVLAVTKSAGYQVGFTTHSGFGLVNNNLLQVRRVSIMAGDSLSTFARKLAFADNDVSWSKMSAYVIDRFKDRLK